MLSSMTPAIVSTVDTIVSAAEIWKTLEKMYSGAGNVMLMVEIEDRLHDLKQGGQSVMDYVAELKSSWAESKSLWADADHYKPIQLPHSECVAWVKKWIEVKRSTLPSLEEAIATISQEEYRLKVMRETASSPSSPIFTSARVKEDRRCFNCNDTGHLICECPKPLKPNSGRGRGSSRGALRGGRDRGDRSGYRANVASSREELSEASEVSFVELEEPRKVKEKCGSSGDQDQESHIGDFVNFAYTDEEWDIFSFDKICKVFPDVMSGVDKNQLFCDACEYAKHTRTSYVSRGIRSVSPFVIVHSDVWTCPTVSISGMKCFVTFIDCFSRMTWIYLMKHKDEVLKCFQDFCALVKTQFNTQVQSHGQSDEPLRIADF
ncbi:hypothetical protein U9M48_005899 [Paspalum notatum var. saurae]|uniref:CCHC-type domain-containing protein n=1 Tax=Paspalum notatum var. saurae TaxID=547442 RepID=A0AAQ3PXN4_PASNO